MKSPNSKASDKNLLELGPVLGEAQQNVTESWKVVVGWFFFGALLGGMLYLGRGWIWESAGLAILALSVGVSIAGARRFNNTYRKQILRVHENGLCFTRGNTSTEIHYSQIDECCCKRTRISGDAPNRDIFDLELKSCSYGGPRRIKWLDRTPHSKTRLQGSINFDALHYQISKSIADNMSATLEVNEKTNWGKSSFICKDGIEVSVKTGVLSSGMRFVSWCELAGVEFHEGQLLLSIESDNWNVKIPCSEPNLFSGYLLIIELLNTHCQDWMGSRQTKEEVATGMAELHVGYDSF